MNGVFSVSVPHTIIAILLGFKSEKQIKPFFICFKGNSYKAWSKGEEAKAKKGQTRNIHIQFSEYGSNENTKTAKIKRNGSGEHIYEGNYFIIQDVTMIRKYFKKHKVRIIKPYTKDIVKPGFDGIWLMRSGGMEKNAKSWGSSSNFEEDYPVYQAASLPLSFSTIWQKAIDLGAPSDNAVASIMYNPKWGYTFEISNTSYKYTFDLKGNQIE